MRLVCWTLLLGFILGVYGAPSKKTENGKKDTRNKFFKIDHGQTPYGVKGVEGGVKKDGMYSNARYADKEIISITGVGKFIEKLNRENQSDELFLNRDFLVETEKVAKSSQVQTDLDEIQITNEKPILDIDNSEKKTSEIEQVLKVSTIEITEEVQKASIIEIPQEVLNLSGEKALPLITDLMALISQIPTEKLAIPRLLEVLEDLSKLRNKPPKKLPGVLSKLETFLGGDASQEIQKVEFKISEFAKTLVEKDQQINLETTDTQSLSRLESEILASAYEPGFENNSETYDKDTTKISETDMPKGTHALASESYFPTTIDSEILEHVSLDHSTDDEKQRNKIISKIEELVAEGKLPGSMLDMLNDQLDSSKDAFLAVILQKLKDQGLVKYLTDDEDTKLEEDSNGFPKLVRFLLKEKNGFRVGVCRYINKQSQDILLGFRVYTSGLGDVVNPDEKDSLEPRESLELCLRTVNREEFLIKNLFVPKEVDRKGSVNNNRVIVVPGQNIPRELLTRPSYTLADLTRDLGSPPSLKNFQTSFINGVTNGVCSFYDEKKVLVAILFKKTDGVPGTISDYEPKRIESPNEKLISCLKMTNFEDPDNFFTLNMPKGVTAKEKEATKKEKQSGPNMDVLKSLDNIMQFGTAKDPATEQYSNFKRVFDSMTRRKQSQSRPNRPKYNNNNYRIPELRPRPQLTRRKNEQQKTRRPAGIRNKDMEQLLQSFQQKGAIDAAQDKNTKIMNNERDTRKKQLLQKLHKLVSTINDQKKNQNQKNRFSEPEFLPDPSLISEEGLTHSEKRKLRLEERKRKREEQKTRRTAGIRNKDMEEKLNAEARPNKGPQTKKKITKKKPTKELQGVKAEVKQTKERLAAKGKENKADGYGLDVEEYPPSAPMPYIGNIQDLKQSLRNNIMAQFQRQVSGMNKSGSVNAPIMQRIREKMASKVSPVQPKSVRTDIEGRAESTHSTDAADDLPELESPGAEPDFPSTEEE